MFLFRWSRVLLLAELLALTGLAFGATAVQAQDTSNPPVPACAFGPCVPSSPPFPPPPPPPLVVPDPGPTVLPATRRFTRSAPTVCVDPNLARLEAAIKNAQKQIDEIEAYRATLTNRKTGRPW
ncbi:hypothetical protein [Anthocerotibacter panamensis]|uniref:hypothetical protein n=1 Tax=Anthocerotibacter panamensis TaxID=2857077 RepID=UPI001C406D2A|nr:hypothetical protein [Anthocerotibacter panamensis]